MWRDVRLAYTTWQGGNTGQVILVLIEDREGKRYWATLQGTPYAQGTPTDNLEQYAREGGLYLDEAQAEKRARERLEQEIADLQAKLEEMKEEKGE